MEKIALLFPGQGSQYIGMAKSLCDQYPIARQTFEEADEVLGYSLYDLCMDGKLSELSRIENALPALLTSSVTAFRVYMQEVGITPQFLAGHSLGEYSALTCSGAIQFADALKIVRKRALLAQDFAATGQGAMTIISGVNLTDLMAYCEQIPNDYLYACVSCYNSIDEVAISGDSDAVQRVEDFAYELGAQVTPLFGNAPFHSRLMQPVADALQEELQKYTFGPIKWPVISNVTASVYEGSHKIVDNLTKQIMMPVQWTKTMEYLKRQGVTMTIEMGAKNVLSNLVKSHASHIRTLSFDHREDRNELIESLAKQPMYSKHKPTVLTKCLAIAVSTPNSNTDSEAYKSGVVDSYLKLQAMQDELESNGLAPNQEQMKQALELLGTILSTKGISQAEQAEWMYQIFDETGTHYLFPEFARTPVRN